MDTIGIPIEQAVNGVEGALYMSSTSGSDGSYTLTISFQVGSNLNTALSLVQTDARTALAQLPGGASAQGITVRKVSTNILLVVNLYADDNRYDETFLANYAIINMQYPLARLPGVGQVAVRGAGKYSMRVWLDPNKLQNYGLTTLDVQRAIQQQNVEVVSGQLGGPPVPGDQAFQFTVNALGRLSDVEEFENIIVKSERGDETARTVRVRDWRASSSASRRSPASPRSSANRPRISFSIRCRAPTYPCGREGGVERGRADEQGLSTGDQVRFRLQHDEVRPASD